MKTEIWKDVIEYEGLYQVSNLGRVKSLNYKHTGKERILKSIRNKDGYWKVALYKNGKRKTLSVHRLVVTAFIEPIPKGLVVNHIDENPANNCVENLEICTHKKNLNHGTCQARRLAARKGRKFSS